MYRINGSKQNESETRDHEIVAVYLRVVVVFFLMEARVAYAVNALPSLTKIPHGHVPKSHVITCNHMSSHVITHVITCDYM